MTDHADTIRDDVDVLQSALRQLEDNCRLLDGRHFDEAEHSGNRAALEALVAERQQAQEDLQHRDAQIQELCDELREAIDRRRQALDALREAHDDLAALWESHPLREIHPIRAKIGHALSRLT